MSVLGGFAAGFGVCAALVVLVAIAIDKYFIDANEPTESRRTLFAGYFRPATAAVVGLLMGLVCGMFIGHFYLPQFVEAVQTLLGK